MTIGDKIKEFRKISGLTQKQLAKECCVAEITIRQYESGKRQPRYEQLQVIAKALNKHLFEFLDDDYFDAATSPDADYEEKLIDTKIKSIVESTEYSAKEKEVLLQDLLDQLEIMTNLHTSNVEAANKFLINQLFSKLNFEGQTKAIEHVEMLAKIPEYQLEQVIDTVSKSFHDGHIRIVKKEDSNSNITAAHNTEVPEEQDDSEDNKGTDD